MKCRALYLNPSPRVFDERSRNLELDQLTLLMVSKNWGWLMVDSAVVEVGKIRSCHYICYGNVNTSANTLWTSKRLRVLPLQAR